MKIILFVIILFISDAFNILAQTTTENYDMWGTSGKITKTTSIIDGKRINNGPISYIGRGNKENTKGVTVTITGNYLKGELNGAYKAAFSGNYNYYDPYYRKQISGSENYTIDCNLSNGFLDGKANIITTSKTYENGVLSYESFDLNYNLSFDKGRVKTMEIKNLYKGDRFIYSTDENNFLHNIQYEEYKEGGFPIRKEIYYLHGIKIWSKKYDVKTKQQLGQTEYHNDTTLINENNYDKDCNCYQNKLALEYRAKKENLKSELAKIDSIEKVRNLLDSKRNFTTREINGLNFKLDTDEDKKGKSKNYEMYRIVEFSKLLKFEDETLNKKINKSLIKLKIVTKDKKVILQQTDKSVKIISYVLSYKKTQTIDGFRLAKDTFTIENYEQTELTEDQLKMICESIKVTSLPFNTLSKEELFKLVNLNDDYFKIKDSIQRKHVELNQINDEIKKLDYIISNKRKLDKEYDENSDLMKKNMHYIKERYHETLYFYFNTRFYDFFNSTFLSAKSCNIPLISD